MKSLVYKKPIIASIPPAKVFEHGKEAEKMVFGKFLLLAEGHSVGLFGVLYGVFDGEAGLRSAQHKDILTMLEILGEKPHSRDSGIIIGGGEIDANHGKKTIRAHGKSYNYGAAPAFMVQGAIGAAEISFYPSCFERVWRCNMAFIKEGSSPALAPYKEGGVAEGSRDEPKLVVPDYAATLEGIADVPRPARRSAGRWYGERGIAVPPDVLYAGE